MINNLKVTKIIKIVSAIINLFQIVLNNKIYNYINHHRAKVK
jgi:hypothetical protein